MLNLAKNVFKKIYKYHYSYFFSSLISNFSNYLGKLVIVVNKQDNFLDTKQLKKHKNYHIALCIFIEINIICIRPDILKKLLVRDKNIILILKKS